MALELKIPPIGESITEVEIGDWLKPEGTVVAKDEPVVTIESEKATIELPAPGAGTVAQMLKKKGDVARVGEVIGHIETDGKAVPTPSPKNSPTPKAEPAKPASPAPSPPAPEVKSNARVMPAAARALAEHGLSPEKVPASGPGGRLLKEDVERQAQPKPAASPAPPAAPAPSTTGQLHSSRVEMASGDLDEEVVPMTPLRRTLAQRLVSAQQTAALLTTINEVDMTAVMSLRKEYGEAFQTRYQTKLGFMSFFVKAVIDGLKQVPQLNAEVRGNDIVYRYHYDIGVAIGGGKGLVVPIVRRAERLGFAEIEKAISDYAARAKENKLKLEELQGGTFTISNGGIYGSLLSTPIVNPPQSGILGLHAIQDRPIARDGAVIIRPMMYLALTYDHRIVDGREAVTFLKRIKEAIENPARMLLEI